MTRRLSWELLLWRIFVRKKGVFSEKPMQVELILQKSPFEGTQPWSLRYSRAGQKSTHGLATASLPFCSLAFFQSASKSAAKHSIPNGNGLRHFACLKHHCTCSFGDEVRCRVWAEGPTTSVSKQL